MPALVDRVPLVVLLRYLRQLTPQHNGTMKTEFKVGEPLNFSWSISLADCNSFLTSLARSMVEAISPLHLMAILYSRQ